MDDVVAHLGSKVSTDCTHFRLGRVCLTHKLSHAADTIFTFHDHSYDRTTCNELYKSWIEGLTLMLGIVCCSLLWCNGEHLQPDDLITLVFDSTDDSSNKSPLDAIRFDGNKSSFFHFYISGEMVTHLFPDRKSRAIMANCCKLLHLFV